MKYVVLETKGRFAAALTEDGSIIKIKNQNYVNGQVIEMKINVTRIPKKITAYAAAAAVMLFVFGFGAFAYLSPYYYVSLDVNPSIEYSLNRFERVLEVNAVNDDGKELLESADLKNLGNKTIDAAIAKTVEVLTEKGYFDGDVEGGIVITTSAKDLKKAAALADELKEDVADQTEENGDDVEVESEGVGAARVAQAKELGVTPGKLNLVEKLKESAADPDDISIEEWLDKPVKEIMQATKENKKAAIEEKKADKSDIDDTDDNDDDTADDSADAAKPKSEAAQAAQQKNEIKQQEKAEIKTETKTEVKSGDDAQDEDEQEAQSETEDKKDVPKSDVGKGNSDKGNGDIIASGTDSDDDDSDVPDAASTPTPNGKGNSDKQSGGKA